MFFSQNTGQVYGADMFPATDQEMLLNFSWTLSLV